MKPKVALTVAAHSGVVGMGAVMGYIAYLLQTRPAEPRPDLGYVCMIHNRGVIRYVTTGECWVQKYGMPLAFGLAFSAMAVLWVMSRRRRQ